MHRVSDGLAVPRNVIESFSGKTTSAAGVIYCDLKYTPKSINHIIVTFPGHVVGLETYRAQVMGLTGRQVMILISRYRYEKADSPTGGANSGGAGADPHAHGLSFTVTYVAYQGVDTELMPTIPVMYEIA